MFVVFRNATPLAKFKKQADAEEFYYANKGTSIVLYPELEGDEGICS